MRSLATANINFSAGKATQENVFETKELDIIKQAPIVAFNPFLVAKKLFLSPYNIFISFLKLIFLTMIIILNGIFLNINYTTETPPMEGVILTQPSEYVNDFNLLVKNEMNIASSALNMARIMEWGNIPQLASLEEVAQIVMTDFKYWENIHDQILTDRDHDNLLSDVFIVNPPSVIWEGYDVWHWLLSPQYLSQGRFPVDGEREVTLSTALLQAHFEMTSEEAHHAIGSHINIEGQAHEIVGFTYNHLAVISHNPSEYFGFYTFDFETFEAFADAKC